MIKENFIKIYEESFKENWALPALTDYGKSKTFTFGDVATEIARIHLLFLWTSGARDSQIALAIQTLQLAPGRQNCYYR